MKVGCILSVDPGVSGAWFLESGQDSEQGRFPAAGGADQGEEFARLDFKLYPAKCLCSIRDVLERLLNEMLAIWYEMMKEGSYGVKPRGKRLIA